MPDKRALLTRLLGRLRIEEQREQFSRLEEFLSRALLPEDLQQVKKSRFSFEAAGLVAPENIATEIGQIVDRLARRKRKRGIGWRCAKCRCAAPSCTAPTRRGPAARRSKAASARFLAWMGGGSGLIFSESKSWWRSMCKGSPNQRCSSSCGPVFGSSASISRSRPMPRPDITSTPAAFGSIRVCSPRMRRPAFSQV